ncbi:MarR family winged helix-turn-helix transcriptional regulator [Anaerolentibacter hominis]|uniref:MarR family winged helix-turn-helix transcriptional regulator n=1 Tax=Anaerolentibacter hominis TaxID=3079009 RepID=UPI0031B80A64
MKPKISLLTDGRKIRKAYESSFKEFVQAYGLTQNELDVLLFLANNPGYDTAKDIVEMRLLSKSHVCKSVETLTRRGFLTGIQDERDRRSIHLTVLEAAGPVVAQARQIQREFYELLYKGITPEERDVLQKIFRKMSENLRHI